MPTTYERIGIMKIPDVLQLVRQSKFSVEVSGNPQNAMIHKFMVLGSHVTLDSVRLRTFAEFGTSCAFCGIQGDYFAIEREPENIPYHFNLYAFRDDVETLICKCRLRDVEDRKVYTVACSPCEKIYRRAP